MDMLLLGPYACLHIYTCACVRYVGGIYRSVGVSQSTYIISMQVSSFFLLSSFFLHFPPQPPQHPTPKQQPPGSPSNHIALLASIRRKAGPLPLLDLAARREPDALERADANPDARDPAVVVASRAGGGGRGGRVAGTGAVRPVPPRVRPVLLCAVGAEEVRC